MHFLQKLLLHNILSSVSQGSSEPSVPDPDEPVEQGPILISFEEISQPSNGEYYEIGETLEVDIIIENSSDTTLNDINVSVVQMPLTEEEYSTTISSLVPGYITTINYSVEVCSYRHDIEYFGNYDYYTHDAREFVSNILNSVNIKVTCTCEDVNPSSNIFNVECTPISDINKEVEIDVIETSIPSTNSAYQEGEILKLLVEYKNIGDINITSGNVSLYVNNTLRNTYTHNDELYTNINYDNYGGSDQSSVQFFTHKTYLYEIPLTSADILSGTANVRIEYTGNITSEDFPNSQTATFSQTKTEQIGLEKTIDYEDSWQIIVDTSKYYDIDGGYNDENNCEICLPIYFDENKFNDLLYEYYDEHGEDYQGGEGIYDVITITVDWGDGNEEEYTYDPDNFDWEYELYHYYSEPGKYIINVKCSEWEDMYIDIGSDNMYGSSGYNNTFKTTLYAICNEIPQVSSDYSENTYNITEEMYNLTYISENIYNNYNTTTFNNRFSECHSLISIPTGLFDNDTAVTDFSYCFYNCYSLISIPTGLFDNCPNVIDFQTCFYGCYSLQSIPTGLFDNCSDVTDFSYCFTNCTSLITIPTGLFDNCSDVTDFSYCFNNCTSLTSIPQDLFKYNTLVNSFDECFYGCSSLTTIPTDLFRYNTDVTSFNYCFYGCSSLTTIPTDLFRYNTVATKFERCFMNCSSLTSIPTDLFRYNTAVTGFQSCFYGCSSLTSIPTDLFKYNTNVTDFNSCFRDCSSLTSIPEHLFDDNNTAVTTFQGCFTGCTSLTSIPQDLFRYNTSVTNFGSCFYECTSITSIPTDLFKYNTAVTDFSWCFYNCSSLTSISQDLFRYNTAVTSFSYCFRGCSSLTSIPTELFKYNTAVTNFGYCFYGCSSLTSIPTGLFDNNTAVTSFDSCFQNCSSLASIPTGLFDNNTAVTSFYGCFRGCSSLTTIPTDLFRYNTAVIYFGYCFVYCSSLNNFTIHIGSSSVSTVSSFVTKKTGTTRTVYVPTGSTTQTKFNGIATSLGLTIIGE